MEKMRTDIEELWCALSDIFVDNETPYQEMAKRISHHDLDVIEFHLFYNVAPACASNLYATPPPIWTGFDEDDLIDDIKKMALWMIGNALFGGIFGHSITDGTLRKLGKYCKNISMMQS